MLQNAKVVLTGIANSRAVIYNHKDKEKNSQFLLIRFLKAAGKGQKEFWRL